MKKLSATQQHVYDLMMQGWQLGISKGLHSYASVQQGKRGHGGQTRDVRLTTAIALARSGYLKLSPESDWKQDIYDPVTEIERKS